MALNQSSIKAITTVVLGNAGDGQVSTYLVHIQCTNPVGLTILVKGRAAGSSLTFVQVPYRKRYLNGAVGDDTYVSTTITDTSVIEVNAAGLDIELDVTGYSSGTVVVGSVPLFG